MKTRFEINGKSYRTDVETLEVLRSLVPAAKAAGDGSAVQAVIFAGLKAGRIVEESSSREPNEGTRRHKLLTAKIRKSLPALYATDGDDSARAAVKFFSPYSDAVWYAFEFDGDDTFFGWAETTPGCGELGYFSLRELAEAARGRLPLVERDCYAGELPTKAELAS